MFWLALCDCGDVNKYPATKLVRKTKQCRKCGSKAQGEKLKTHGLTYTKEMKQFWGAKRRADKLKRTPPWADKDKIKETYQNCPKGMAVDHIIPLRGKLVSGLHVHNNLQYLSTSENSKKTNKFEPLYIKYE